MFDEVNKNQPSTQIDLNCLELDDALAISKQKIFDLAEQCAMQPSTTILSVMTSEWHIQSEVNMVLEMIQQELNLDNYYLRNEQVVLVKIDEHTINNPVLKEW